MFFLKRLVKYNFLLLIIVFSQGLLYGQCLTPIGAGFIFKPGFETLNGADKFEVNSTLNIKALPYLNVKSRASIRYRIGYLGKSTFQLTDLSCVGQCKTDPNVIIPTVTSFEVVQSPDLSVTFNKPGYYYILQTYNDDSGTGYYDCLRITVYPKADFDYRICGCNQVIITIPKTDENLFYDEIDVKLEIPFHPIIVETISRIKYGQEIKLPSLPDDPLCSKRGDLSITSRVLTPFFTESGKREINGIDFTINKSGGGDINYVEELRCNLNGEFDLKFTSAVDEIEISTNKGLTWSTLPPTSYTVMVSGKVFKITGITPPTTGELCFRGNTKCGSISTEDAAKPKVCYTGEIESITDKFQKDSENRTIEVNLKNKTETVDAAVRVYRDENTTNESVITSATDTYIDVKPTCGTLSYRTLTTTNGRTYIYSKPVTYKLSAANLKPVEIAVVSIKSTSYAVSGQLAELILNLDENNPIGKTFNIYKSVNSGAFNKVNSSPVKEFFPDFTTDPTVLNCYFVKSVDQCGYESPPSKTICTTLLEANGNLIKWSNENVAVNSKNEYEKILGYIPKIMECSGGNCIENVLKFPIIKNENIFNMDLADLDPENVHSVNIRLNVQLAGIEKKDIYSNIVEFFFQPKIFIPSIITPNGDSINDDLNINGFHIKDLIFEIYDRWGTKIETLRNLTPNQIQRWIPASTLPEGEYFYKATATDYSTIPKEITKQGSILLVR